MHKRKNLSAALQIVDKPHVMRSQITTCAFACGLHTSFMLLFCDLLPAPGTQKCSLASDCQTSLDSHPLCVLFLQSWRLMPSLLPLNSVMCKLHCCFILLLFFAHFFTFFHLLTLFLFSSHRFLPSCVKDQPPPNTTAF